MDNLLWILVAITLKGLSYADDLPCNKVPTEYGYICVCDSSYCDTIYRPSKISPDQFHQYTTSGTSPGFTHTQGQFSSFSADAEYVFTVNNSEVRQEFFGVGGSFTNSAGLLLNNLSVATQEKLLESYFSTRGIEYSMARVPIAASDFSPRAYTFDDVPADYDLKYFNLTYEEYNYKIPAIQKAISVSERGLKLIGCTWGAPTWMKMNNSSRGGYLGMKYSSPWAKYHVKFLDAYKKEGLEFWGISGSNELVLDYLLTGVVPMVSTAMQQRDWFKNHLKPQLVAANYSDVKLITLEDQRMFVFYYMNRFAEDPDSYEILDAIGIHWYFDKMTPVIILDRLHERHPEKYILYTETSINFGRVSVMLGGWERAQSYAYSILECLNHWTQSYLDWNLFLDTDGGPTMSFGIDAPVIINTTSGEFYKQPMFYVLGHFSKFIPPGSKIVQVIKQESSTNELKQNEDETREKIRKIMSNNHLRGFDPYVVPSTVLCTATTNSDGSHSLFVLNTKNTTATVRIEVSEVGNIFLSAEPESLITFVYWI